MRATTNDQSGFSLLETVFAIGVLSVGALGMAGTFTQGMQRTVSSPNELIATQKAAEAVESVFSARDSHLLTWSQLRNENYGGVFIDGPQPLKLPGPDGIVNTHDDTLIESFDLPGPDQLLGNADDVTKTLDGFTREIKLVDLTDDLRSITVTVTFKSGPQTRSYSITAYISTWA